MFDTPQSTGPGRPGHRVADRAVDVPVGAATIARWVSALAGTDRGVGDAERVDQIRALEELKAAACAAQARATADLDASMRRQQAEARVPAARRGQGIGSQVALARRESPARGNQHLGLAQVLTTEMPHTLRAMQGGWLSEWRATLLARETGWLSLADRRTIDRVLAGGRDVLEPLSDRQLVAEARRLAYRLDPESVVRRNRRAEADRTVTCRPAPDTMTYLTGLLPVAQGVAVLAALTREADTRRAAGDKRSRSQIMADTLVERVTGLSHATDIPLEIQLVMTDRALLGGDPEPAHLPGYGIVPAAWARALTSTASPGSTGSTGDQHTRRVWIRRLYTAPTTGQLVALDSRRRLAPPGLAALIEVRDQTCRTPWCDAPIRHRDHIRQHDQGGPTTAENLQGLCEHCNHAKQAPGWHARPRPGPRHTVEVTTPTGHIHHTAAPPLPGAPLRCSIPEFNFTQILNIA